MTKKSISLSKDLVIHSCVLFYVLFEYGNITTLLIYSLKLKFPISQIINYIPLLVLLFGWNLIPNKRQYIVNKKFLIFTLFLFCYLTIGFIATCLQANFGKLLLIVPSFSRSLIDFFIFLHYFIFLINKKSTFTTLLKNITILSFITTISILLFYSLDFELYKFYQTSALFEISRPSGLFVNPNTASFYGCVTTILLVFWLFRTTNFIKRFLLLVLIGFCAISVFATFSNTGQICFISIILIGLFKSTIFSKNFISSLFIIVSLLFIVGSNINVSKLKFNKDQLKKIENFYNLVNFKTQNVKLSHRDKIVSETIPVVLKNPILGYGLGSHRLVHKTWGTHNMYLGIILDAGIISLVLYILFLISCGIKGMLLVGKLRDIGFLLSSWMALVLLYSLASHNVLDQPFFYSFTILILIISTPRIIYSRQIHSSTINKVYS